MKDDVPRTARRSRPAEVALFVLTCSLSVFLGLVVMEIPRQTRALKSESHLSMVNEEAVEKSGVGNPVTAVLLNFRAYDTLLELAVVLLAVLGVQAAGAGSVDRDAAVAWKDNRILQAAVAIIVPVSIVVAGDLLWMGADFPGGAFQAGAVLSGAGIMLILSDRVTTSSLNHGRSRLAAVAGVAAFAIVGILVMTAGNSFLQYPVGYAKVLILAIETAAMVSIAIVFVALFGAVARLPKPAGVAPQEEQS